MVRIDHSEDDDGNNVDIGDDVNNVDNGGGDGCKQFDYHRVNT